MDVWLWCTCLGVVGGIGLGSERSDVGGGGISVLLVLVVMLLPLAM